MEGFTTKSVIEHQEFTDQADALLAQATKPEVSVKDMLHSVGLVQNALESVENGTVEVQPPLTDTETAVYKAKVETATAVGEKALDALQDTGKRRFGRRARREAAAEASAPFVGTGSAAKS